MELIQATRSTVTLAFSIQDLEMVNNALNEICNGIDLPEFETRIGAKPEDVKALLKSINAALKRADTAPID